jgi:LuxR family quorum-sensing system transcriptional regulator SolR
MSGGVEFWNRTMMSSGLSLNDSIDMFARLLEARSPDDFAAAMEKAAKLIGFDRFMVGMQWFGPQGDTRFRVISGYPIEWQTLYLERGYMNKDPTVGYCQTNTDPVVWDDAFFAKTGSLDLLEEARSYGLGFGISLPVHEALGVKSMISLARDQSLDNNPAETQRLLSAGAVLSSCGHFAYRKLLSGELHGKLDHPLTPQEREVLRWLALGKTSSEIGSILKIAEGTAIFHVKNLMQKLDVRNRPQAVAVAFRMGLIN